MESLGRPSASLGDLLHAVPLVLKMNSFGVPVIDLFWYSIEEHNLLHEQDRDFSSEETNQDIVVCDAGASGVTLEGGNVTFEQGGELSVLLGHALGGQPKDGVPSGILMFKS